MGGEDAERELAHESSRRSQGVVDGTGGGGGRIEGKRGICRAIVREQYLSISPTHPARIAAASLVCIFTKPFVLRRPTARQHNSGLRKKQRKARLNVLLIPSRRSHPLRTFF
jgi:hypothetical protein